MNSLDNGTNGSIIRNLESLTDTDRLFAETIVLLEKIDTSLAEAPLYSAIDKQRSTKLPAGAERVVPALAALVHEHGVTVPGKPVGPMLRSLERIQELAPIRRRLMRTLRRVDDLVFDAQATCWQDGSTFYGVLKEIAKRNPVVQRDMEPVTEFFTTRRNYDGEKEDEKRFKTLAAKRKVSVDSTAIERGE